MKVGEYPPVAPKNVQAEESGCTTKVVGVALGAFTIIAAYYLMQCGMKEGTCKIAPESADAYSFLHDIMGLLN